MRWRRCSTASRGSVSHPPRSSSPTTARARRPRKLIAAFTAGSPVPARTVRQPHEGFRVARLRNLAIAASSADYMVFVDGDMVLHPEFVADHARAARRGWFTQGVRILADPALTTRLLAEPAHAVSPFSSGLGGAAPRLSISFARGSGAGAPHRERLHRRQGLQLRRVARRPGARQRFQRGLRGMGPGRQGAGAATHACRGPPADAAVRRHRDSPAPRRRFARRPAREPRPVRGHAPRPPDSAARRDWRLISGNMAPPNSEVACPANPSPEN